METRADNTPVRANFSVSETPIPRTAQVVIVGGGIAGAALAFEFARAGWEQVCLLEQNQISSGTTWHSAGQVGQLRSSNAQTQVNRASAELFANLAELTGHDPGWLQCGGLQLASCRERMHQLERNAAIAEQFGVQADLVTPAECAEHWPMLNTSDLVGGVYLPGDGRVLPGECTVALAKGAMQRGVTIHEGVEVQQLQYQTDKLGRRQFTGVQTNRGEIDADWVILAGNMWMRQLGLAAGVDIPVYPCEHHYVITRPIEGVTRNCPCTRDPNAGLYFRALDDGGLKLGAFKKRSKAWQVDDHVPADFAFGLLDPDWPDFNAPFQDHCHRLQGISRQDVVKFVNGPEAFTPDNNFIMGQPADTDGLFVCGGWNSAGIACAGGAAKYAVEWIQQGSMTLDLHAVDILRFRPSQNRRSYLQERVQEVLGLHYQMAWPGRQMETARGERASNLHAAHARRNACFGESAGWERPLFYADAGQEPRLDYSFVQQNWHDAVIGEVHACRRQAGLLDLSSLGKLRVVGPDAADMMQYLCAANVDTHVGRSVYTAMLNKHGRYVADLIVARVASDEYYLLTGSGRPLADLDWLRRHQAGRNVDIVDVTEQWNVIGCMGPNAENVLADVFGERCRGKFAYGTIANWEGCGTEVRAIRVSYVGESGWELHVPPVAAETVYEALFAAGEAHGVRAVGTLATNTMRIEKGLSAWGHELSSQVDPREAGLDWTVDTRKEFLGKAAYEAAATRPRTQRLARFQLLDPNVTLWGGEPIFVAGQSVGYTTSACFGPTVGASVGLGVLQGEALCRLDDLESQQIEIQQLGRRWAAQANWA